MDAVMPVTNRLNSTTVRHGVDTDGCWPSPARYTVVSFFIEPSLVKPLYISLVAPVNRFAVCLPLEGWNAASHRRRRRFKCMLAM